MKRTPRYLLRQGVCYLAGLLLIALGINISKLSSLGISPVSSVPRACELIWGFTLGTTTMIIYCLLVLTQLLVLRKKFPLRNLLGIAVAVVFGWMIDLLGTDPAAFGHLLLNFPRPETYLLRLVYLVAALGIIGLGVYLYLRPRWVPMPSEGLAGAISTVTGKLFGDCKTAVDTGMILLALLLQLVFLGGLQSFTGDSIVIREGTVVMALCVGQVVKLLTKTTAAPLERFLGQGE